MAGEAPPIAPAEAPAAAPPTFGVLAKARRPNPQWAQFKRTFYFLRRNTLAMVGLGILLFFIGVAIYSFAYPAPGDQLTQLCGTYGNINTSSGCLCTYPTGTAPPGPGCYQVSTSSPSIIAPTAGIDFSKPSFTLGPLPLGSLTVDTSGSYFFNLLAGLIKGAPWSLGIAATVVACGSTIGLLLGAVAGYEGGVVDEVIMRATDIFLAIPGLLLLIVILATAGALFHGLEGRLLILIAAFIATDWPIYTRIVRSQVLVTRELKFVEAARASGSGHARILRKHIIPNSLYPVFVQMSLDVGTVPLALAVLVFLGFNIFPSQYFPEWGSITALSVNERFLKGLLTYCEVNSGCTFPWWQIFIPGITLFLFAISVNFLSDGLRDALDPRLRR